MNTSKLINIDKLFSVIGRFFTNKENCLLELIQNAQRSGASEVKILAPLKGASNLSGEVYNPNILSIRDNGEGVTDLAALLGIAHSDWKKQKVEDQQPAGLGFLQLVSLAKRIYVMSKFGEIIIDCKRFTNNSEYRQQVIEARIEPCPNFKGTYIEAEMEDVASSYLHHNYQYYRGFDVELSVNEQLIPRLTIDMIRADMEKSGDYIEIEFKGNTLLISFNYSGLETMQSFYGSTINWYGQYIPVFGLIKMRCQFYYEVKAGTPLTPRYPDRNNIVNDFLYEEFRICVTRAVVEYCRLQFEPDNFKEQHKHSIRHHSYLCFLYEEMSDTELGAIDYIPIVSEYKEDLTYSDEDIIASKAELSEANISYTTQEILANGSYKLAGVFRDKQPRVLLVSDIIGEHLAKLGARELKNVTIGKTRGIFHLSELPVEFKFSDGSSKNYYLVRGLVNNSCSYSVIADSQHKIIGTFDEFAFDVAFEGDLPYEEQVERDRAYIVEVFEEQFNILSKNKFSFLPQYYNLSGLKFDNDHGKIILNYADGTEKQMALGDL